MDASEAKKAQYAAEGKWTFEVRKDTFKNDCMLDLRNFNEKTAGEKGWMYAKDGKLYIPGSDQPFRGWAAGLRPFGCSYDMEELAYTARKYAKSGINQVREMSDAHAAVLPDFSAGDADITRIRPEGLDALHKLVAAMKAEGIYVTYCPWWLIGIKIKNHPQIDGFFTNGKPFYWSRDLRELQKNWYRQILTPVNPYTGIPLAEEPALNIIELQNEENLLFWGLSPECCDKKRWNELRVQFTAFVEDKYGSVEKAVVYWQLDEKECTRLIEEHDNRKLLQFTGNHLMTYDAFKWESAAMNRYGGDLIEFAAKLELEYNEEMSRFIKEVCGYKGLILGGDWYACDHKLLDDLSRYTTLTKHSDCIGYHQYSSFFHLNTENPSRSSSTISVGDYYLEGSVLANPSYIPVNYKRMKGVPMICTEIGIPEPNRYALEGQLAAAAYGSLQDHDQIAWLQVEFNGLGNHIPWNGSINKFNHNWPHIMGQFPGAALLYRMGYVKEAPVVVLDKRSMADITAKKLPLLANVQSGDPLYSTHELKSAKSAGEILPGGVDPMAFQVGAVEFEIDGSSESFVDYKALESCIDRENKTVKSITGELRLDWGSQVLTIDTPYAQGAVGLLGKAGVIELSDVVIEIGNRLASVLVISLDGKPLAGSEKILLQAVTESCPSGWESMEVKPGTSVEYSEWNGNIKRAVLPQGTRRVEAIGDQPFKIDRMKGKVIFRDGKVRSAIPLDLYGYEVSGEIAAAYTDKGFEIVLPEDTYYTIVNT